MPLDTITRRDIAARVVAIVRESGSPTAARARGALSSFFVWAMQMGLVENNPTIGSTKPAESKPRERVLSDEELARIWRACGDDAFGKIIKLLILTGCRRAEVGDMCWSEINLDRGTFTIPARRAKNGKAHTLPVMPVMLDIITSVPRLRRRGVSLRGQGSNRGNPDRVSCRWRPCQAGPRHESRPAGRQSDRSQFLCGGAGSEAPGDTARDGAQPAAPGCVG